MRHAEPAQHDVFHDRNPGPVIVKAVASKGAAKRLPARQ